MKGLVLVLVGLFGLGLIVVNNKQVVELVDVDANHFCMYMGAEKDITASGELKLGLIGCFEGNPYDVNEADEELGERMWKEKPVIKMNYKVAGN
jgi:hypothetical protein